MSSITSPSPAPHAGDQFVNMSTAGAMLDVSRPTLWKYVKTGRLSVTLNPDNNREKLIPVCEVEALALKSENGRRGQGEQRCSRCRGSMTDLPLQHYKHFQSTHRLCARCSVDLRVRAHKTRAEKWGLTEHFTIEEWISLLISTGGVCQVCGTVELLSMDHMIPFAQGGSNRIENIQALCRGCNASKGKGKNVSDIRNKTQHQLVVTVTEEQRLLVEKYCEAHAVTTAEAMRTAILLLKR
ncbi:MAG: HNH endonuclease [Armatimonadota bacterium]|nr:HNH endonuclease [Armatimonadota bacterium]